MKLSIVIPVLNEADILGETLECLRGHSVEIIVVDGGSTDDTIEIARQYTSRVLISPRGRGLQQDTGARQSHGSVLLFLHADTRLPATYERLIYQALESPRVVFGAFRLRIEASPRQAAGNVLPDGRASQHRKDDNFLDIRSLTPQQATGNALAYAVQRTEKGQL
jgi:glycosyltransferase involved in cell wall biosynthesis